MSKQIIENGSKFGKWSVLEFDKQKKKYKVQCECGNIRYYAGHSISGTGKKTVKGCSDCIQKKPRPHMQLPNDLSLKRRIYQMYKDAAKRRDYEFLLTENEFFDLIFRECFYCGIDVSMSNSEQRFRGRSIKYNGVDRINNSIGYTKDNCVTCCKTCNNSKSTLSLDEWDNWIKRIYKFRHTK